MSLSYKTQQTITAIGSKDKKSKAITGETLTAEHTDNSYTISSGGYSKVNIDMQYTMAGGETGNGVSLIIENSPDGVNWFRTPNESTTDGTSTLFPREFVFSGENEGTKNLSFGLDVFYKHLRFSFKETDVATNFGTIYAELTLCE